jgi:acyl-CoA thioesterase
MDSKLRSAIFHQVENEPLARTLGMKLVELESGFSAVEMTYRPETMDNIYQRAHGGALFALIDEAFETVGQTEGEIVVALTVNVTYVSSPEPGALLRAEARQFSRTRRTAGYLIDVRDRPGALIASCQAVGYCTGKPVSFG